MVELTVERAREILEQEEQRRLKKNEALRAWREKNRTKYNEYIRQWHANRKAMIELAKAVVEEAK